MSQEVHNATDATAHVEAAGHGAETAAHGAEGATGGFPPFDSSLFEHQIFWFAVCFGALYLILTFAVLPRFAKTIANRKETIENDLKAAALEAQAAESAKAASIAAQNEARASARSKLDAMRKSVDDENAMAQAKALAETEEQIKASEASIAAQKAESVQLISDEVLDIASAIVEQLSGKKPTAADLKAATKGVN